MKHTDTPWRLEPSNKNSTDRTIYVFTPPHGNPKYIGRVYGEGILSQDISERDANAEFITRACNAHEGLVETLKQLEEYASACCERDTPQPPCVNNARQAIAKAEGK